MFDKLKLQMWSFAVGLLPACMLWAVSGKHIACTARKGLLWLAKAVWGFFSCAFTLALSAHPYFRHTWFINS